jgi:hypothetical protein
MEDKDFSTFSELKNKGASFECIIFLQTFQAFTMMMFLNEMQYTQYEQY